jgi:hypothetical protein
VIEHVSGDGPRTRLRLRDRVVHDARDVRIDRRDLGGGERTFGGDALDEARQAVLAATQLGDLLAAAVELRVAFVVAAAACTAKKSTPSTDTAGMPIAAARAARSRLPATSAIGVISPQPLSSITKIFGSFSTTARFIAS